MGASLVNFEAPVNIKIQFWKWFRSKQQPEWLTKWLQKIAMWFMIGWAVNQCLSTVLVSLIF